MLFNICKTAYSSQGCVKNMMEKVRIILLIDSTCFKPETQNLYVRSTTKTVLRIYKDLEQDAFLDKQFFENCQAYNFIAI